MVYTIVGDSSRLIEFDKTLKKIREKNLGINEKIFDASLGEQESFIENAQVFSMFASKELLILKRGENVDKLTDFLNILTKFNLDQKEIIIDIEKKGNNFGKKAEGIAKELGKLIIVKESTQGENAISFIKEELSIDNKLAYELKEMIGTDIQLVKNELDKIKNYFDTRKFDLVEARKIISIKEEYSIFEVIDKVIKGNKKEGLNYIEKEGNTHLFLYNLGQEFKNLFKLKLLIQKGKLISSTNYNTFQKSYNNNKEYFKNSKGFMHPYGIFKKLENLKYFDLARLKELIELSHETEYKIKNGYGEYKRLVELMILKI